MDFPRDPTPKLNNSFSSLLFFYCKKETQQKKKPPMHFPTSASPLLEPPGLKTLTSPLNRNRSLTCIKPNLFSSFSSSTPSSSAMDHDGAKTLEKEREKGNIGIENSLDENNGEPEEKKETTPNERRSYLLHQPSCHRRRTSCGETREFPPPIPLLARTGNLPCHMPWVLKRIRGNGRLVIQEVKVKHHEFFRANRSNGRLTLQLMHLDDSLLSPPHPSDLNPDPPKQEQENPDEIKDQEERLMEKTPLEETSIANDKHHSQSSLQSPKEKSIEEHNPSTPPPSPSPCRSPSPPSMPGPAHLINSTAANHDNGALQEKSSLWEIKNMNMPNVSGIGPLPSKLSPSLPESPFVIGGNGGGCSASRRSDSLFQMPVPTIRPILG